MDVVLIKKAKQTVTAKVISLKVGKSAKISAKTNPRTKNIRLSI